MKLPSHTVRRGIYGRAGWLLLAIVFATGSADAERRYVVHATVETDSVPSRGDAADDPCIWVHPDDPAESLIIGTDKDAGLAVFDLTGDLLQFVEAGELNNVDVRYGFPVGDERRDIVVAGNRTDNTMAIFFVDAETRRLTVANTQGPLGLGMDVYGSCLYRSPKDGAFYAFFNSKEGAVQQWWLRGHADASVSATLVRTLKLESQTEGCVADDELGYLYLGEEGRGIWKFDAEPNARTETPILVDACGADGHLTADVEGLTISYGEGEAGYLIASSQGSDAFVVYERGDSNRYLFSFHIGEGNGIDAVTETDGIDVIATGLGAAFPRGVFVAQDDRNDSGAQNFKLVDWSAIAALAEPRLATNPTHDPRD